MDILPDNTALGIAATIVLAVIGAAWSLASKIGRLQRAVEDHGHTLRNGLISKVADHSEELAGIRAHHQLQDERLKEIKDALEKITNRLEQLPCPGRWPSNRTTEDL